jgi:hypothetical protein
MEKVTIRLREGDREFLKENVPEIPMNQLIRRLVSNFVDSRRAGVRGLEMEDIRL